MVACARLLESLEVSTCLSCEARWVCSFYRNAKPFFKNVTTFEWCYSVYSSYCKPTCKNYNICFSMFILLESMQNGKELCEDCKETLIETVQNCALRKYIDEEEAKLLAR